MNLRHIELFIAVVDAGGVTRAAGRLGLAQPAVSTAVRRLEKDVGAPLLVRGARGASLTPEGAAFLRHGRSILAQVAESRREIAAVHAGERGHISLGAPPMVTEQLLPGVIGGFLSERPGLSMTVLQAGAEECAAGALRGDLDLGIIADWRTPEGLTTQLLQNHPMVACVAASSPLAAQGQISWEELLDQPLILFPHGYHQRSRVQEAARRLGQSPSVVIEAEAVPLILELVRRGQGVATLLSAAAEGMPGIVSIALPSEATVPIALCRRANAPASNAVEALRLYLVEEIGAVGSAGGGGRAGAQL